MIQKTFRKSFISIARIKDLYKEDAHNTMDYKYMNLCLLYLTPWLNRNILISPLNRWQSAKNFLWTCWTWVHSLWSSHQWKLSRIQTHMNPTSWNHQWARLLFPTYVWWICMPYAIHLHKEKHQQWPLGHNLVSSKPPRSYTLSLM